MTQSVRLRILRQDAPDRPATRRFEEYAVEVDTHTTVMGALFQLVERVSLAFDAACFSERCGACTLLVNGFVRTACGTRVTDFAKKGTLTLEPLGRFPLVRDLSVYRSRVRASLVALGCTSNPQSAKRLDRKTRRHVLALDRCSECGACLEACPEWNEAGFSGAAALNELFLLEILPSGESTRDARLDALLGPNGVHGCGKNENCVEVCPERIPLVDSILGLERVATKSLFRR